MQTASAHKWLKMKQTKACRFHVHTQTYYSIETQIHPPLPTPPEHTFEHI